MFRTTSGKDWRGEERFEGAVSNGGLRLCGVGCAGLAECYNFEVSTGVLEAHSFSSAPQQSRGVAQPGRAPGSGPGGRRFKSSLPDQSFLVPSNRRKTGALQPPQCFLCRPTGPSRLRKPKQRKGSRKGADIVIESNYAQTPNPRTAQGAILQSPAGAI